MRLTTAQVAKLNLWLSFLSVAFFGLAVIFLLVNLRSLRTDLLAPPLKILNATGDAENRLEILPGAQSQLCPGGEVLWVVEQQTLRDTDAYILRGLKAGAVGIGETIYKPETLAPLIHMERISLERGDHQQGLRSFVLPEWLKPGDYYILNSITAAQSKPVRYGVPFTIGETCEQKQK